jgi:hypothetical protein
LILRGFRTAALPHEPSRQPLTPRGRRRLFLLAASFWALPVAAGAGPAALTLQWDPPVDGRTSGYVVFYGPAPGVYAGARDVGFVTAVPLPPLPVGTTYCFSVQAYNAAGEVSEPSDAVCRTVTDAPPPTVPRVPPGAPPPPSVPPPPSPPRGPNPVPSHPPPGRTLPNHLMAPTFDCPSEPSAPANLQSRVLDGRVTLTWMSATDGCPATGFTLFAGSTPWSVDLGSVALDSTTLAVDVPPGTYYVFVHAQNAVGMSPPSNLLTVSVGPPNSAPAGAQMDGRLRVGVDVPAGRYFTDPSYGCYFERDRGAAGVEVDVLGFDAAQWIVDLLPGDLTVASNLECGTWSQVPPRGVQDTIVGGTWLVGAQLAPGTYAANVGPGCYWARLSGFSFEGTVENAFYAEGGPAAVTIDATDVGFHADGDCGTWARVDAAVAPDVRVAPSGASRQEIESRRQQNLQQEMSRVRRP